MGTSLCILESTSISPFNPTRRVVTPLLRVCIHCLLCMICVILGLRMSQEIQIVVSFWRPGSYSPLSRRLPDFTKFEEAAGSGGVMQDQLHLKYGANARGLPAWNVSASQRVTYELPNSTALKKGVSVGRHKILIRPWPHVKPEEMMVGFGLLRTVQLVQDSLYGVPDRRPILAVTPTFVRPFQAVYLTGLLHTLSLVVAPVTWIVVEAGGVTNETSLLLKDAQVERLVHLGLNEGMPYDPEEQVKVEMRMRIEGLRYIRDQRWKGIVMFIEEGNIHNLQLFDEVQSVRWVGAFSIGMLIHTRIGHLNLASETADNNYVEHPKLEIEVTNPQSEKDNVSEGYSTRIQGPVCNALGNITGWHIPEDGKQRGDERLLPGLEWAGFALNAEAIWDDNGINRPSWINMWDDWANGVGLLDVRDVVETESLVEPLGSCGKKILMWWARVEADGRNKHPPKWAVDRQLQVVVSAKRTHLVIHSNKPPALALLAPVHPAMDDATLDRNRDPGVKVDAGVPVGKEPMVRRIIPRTGKMQGTLEQWQDIKTQTKEKATRICAGKRDLNPIKISKGKINEGATIAPWNSPNSLINIITI